MVFDYLVIGHVTEDMVKGGANTVGGTAAYSACMAGALCSRVGILTSTAPDFDFSQLPANITVENILSTETTSFENIYSDIGRVQFVSGLADHLMAQHIPLNWRAEIVHIGPVVGECDLSLLDRFKHTFVGVTPQGWMRQWDKAGCVSRCNWEQVEPWLARANAVVLSDEDVGGDWELIKYYATLIRILVVTQNCIGCTVYVEGECTHYEAPQVENIVDATGAGDIFAAAFFVALQTDSSVGQAARFANFVASESVRYSGLESVLYLLEG